MDMTAVEVQRGLQEFYGSGRMGHGGPRVSDVVLLGSGFEADVFAFSLEANGENPGEPRELVLRIYAGEGGGERSARECAVLGRLREAGYPVPQVVDLPGDRSPVGRPSVIMERIHGVPLEWSPPQERRQELQELHCRLMVRLHALTGSVILPESPLAGSRDPYAFIDEQLSGLSTLLTRLEGREPPSLRDALAWLGSRRSQVPCQRLAVLHGDFHRNNILMRADGRAFVIDWSNVRLGDCRSDLAWIRLLMRADAQPDGGQSELHLYQRLAHKAVSKIEYFEVAACTRLLTSTLISLQFGAAGQGMRPGAEALMRRNTDFMKYVAALLQRRTGLKMPDLEATLSAHLG